MKKIVLVFSLFWGFLAFLNAEETEVLFETLSWQEVPEEDRLIVFPALTEALQKTEEHFQGRYLLPLVFGANPREGNKVRIVLSVSSEQKQIIFSGSVGFKSVQKVLSTPWDDELAPILTAFFIAILDESDKGGTPVSVRYLDAMGFNSVMGQILPSPHGQLFPFYLAFRQDGRFLVQSSGSILEFDTEFRFQGEFAAKLMKQNPYLGMAKINLTSGGTLIMKPITGQEVYYYFDTSDEILVKKTPFAQNLNDFYGVFPDGRILISDSAAAQPTFLSPTRTQSAPWLSMKVNRSSGTGSLGIGPENTVHLYDGFEGSLKIYTEDGKFVRCLFPLKSTNGGETLAQVRDDGSFLLMTYQGVEFFDSRGALLASLSGPGFQRVGGAQIGDAKVDPSGRLLFVSDYSTRKILKFLLKEEIAELSETEKALLRLSEERSESSSDDKLEEYRLHLKNGAAEKAYYELTEYTATHPNDSAASREARRMELVFLQKKILRIKDEALEKLKAYGPETARPSYAQAMTGFERLIKEKPEEESLRDERIGLWKAFREAEASLEKNKATLTISSIVMENLFPSQMQYYRNHPPGAIRIKNSLSSPVKNLHAEVLVRRYMDFPAQTESLALLNPGDEKSLALPVLLNTGVFDLQEDLPLQVAVKIYYTDQFGPQEMEKSIPVMLFRRSALSWDDPAKLASFIMPNEETVNLFASRASEGRREIGLVPGNLLQAAMIADALGVYGIRYAPDPQSPITEVLGQKTAVDTVRFPRTTLLYQSGDCDDTTSLLASLLESEGIPTAILTTPGHVFLAFDSGESSENAWIYEETGLSVIEHKGRLWIPLESTVLSDGFVGAWREASQLVRRYQGGAEWGLTIVADSRANFPPLPIPGASIPVNWPEKTSLEKARSATVDLLLSDLYLTQVKNQESALKGLKGRALAKALVKLGTLHARFGKPDLAEAAFRQGMLADPASLASAVNLAELKMSQGRWDEARGLLESAYKVRSESVVVNLLLAQVWNAIGKPSQGASFFAYVVKNAPELAAQYPALAPQASASALDSGRAQESGKTLKPIWMREE